MARHIVVRDLRFEQGQFSQAILVFVGNNRYVSWEPAQHGPTDRSDPWMWLAGNTIRIWKTSRSEQPPPSDHLQSVRTIHSERGDKYIYDMNLLPAPDNVTFIHLALPANFLLKAENLKEPLPFYAKKDQGRISIDWVVVQGDVVQCSFELTQCETEDFQRMADECVDSILKKAERSRLREAKPFSRNASDPVGTKELSEQWLSKLKNKPTVAAVIVVATILLAVLTWTNEIAGIFKKLEDTVHSSHASKRSAYDVGEVVAWISYLQTDGPGTIPPDIQRSADQKFAELGTDLNDLGIKVDYRQLDYKSRTAKNYQDSPAALFLRDQITDKDGREAQRAYSLGARLEAILFMADKRMFGMSDTGYNVMLELDSINDEAEHFGAKPVTLDPEDYLDRETINVGMRVKAETLDLNVRGKL